MHSKSKGTKILLIDISHEERKEIFDLPDHVCDRC